MANITRQLARPSGLFARWLLGLLWNRRNTALNDAAFSLVFAQAPRRILEVGFGGGYLLQRLLGQPAVEFIAGIDHSLAMVKFSYQHLFRHIQAGKLQLALASADAIPWAKNCFDCIVSVNSIFYWADPIRAIDEFSRILIPGGRLVLVYTCSQDLRNRPFDIRSLGLHDPLTLENWLNTAGFNQVKFDQKQDRHRHFWCIQAESGGKKCL
jgi:SAM-dependent methyltransferase